MPKKLRTVFMLAASYFFYMCWNAKYIVLIVGITVITYTLAIAVYKTEREKIKKLLLVSGLIACFGLLVLFKYSNFLIENINLLLNALRLPVVAYRFDFLLPVGISFYTFQGLSYLIDVFKGDVEPEKNILKYALFVSFFPQLVAGPIERSKNLLKQIDNISEISFKYDNLANGLILMLWGMFQKIVIADRLSIFVDEIYNNLYRCGTVETVLCMFAFSLQIYCDFGGYSSIAIGAAKVMGIELMENFNAPYLSTSIAEFWRKWHISLSSWFKDYLYIPLGGNRRGKLYKYRNIFITFLVSGLWHGANWTFVIWGGIHAVYQIVEDILAPIRHRIEEFFEIKKEVFSYSFFNISRTFLLTSFAWIFFRASNLGEAVDYIVKMFTRWNPWALFNESIFEYGLNRRECGILFLAIIILILVDCIRRNKKMVISQALMNENYCFRLFVVAVLVIMVLIYGKYGIEFDSAKFIYFDF